MVGLAEDAVINDCVTSTPVNLLDFDSEKIRFGAGKAREVMGNFSLAAS